MRIRTFSFSAAAWVSAVLFLLVIISAITSYWYAVMVVFPTSKTSNLWIEFGSGGVGLTSRYCYPADWIASHPATLSKEDGNRLEVQLVERDGLRTFRVLVPQYYGLSNWGYRWKSMGFEYTTQPAGVYWMLVVPHYFLLWLFSLLPICWLWIWRKRRRESLIARRICLRCGYDLRASSENCPECGQSIPSSPPTIPPL